MTGSVKHNLGDNTWVWYCPVRSTTKIRMDVDIYNAGCFWHREDGPARWNGWKTIWYYNNETHRYDGPADSEFTDIAFIHGKKYSMEEYVVWLKDMGMDIDNLTPDDKLLIDMKWS